MSRFNRFAPSILALAVILTSLAFLQQGSLPEKILERQENTIALRLPEPDTVRRVAASLNPITEEPALTPLPIESQAEQILSDIPAQEGIELHVESQASAATATRIPIIEYHYSTFYFDGVMMKPEWFQEQMEWLADQGYYTLTIDELADFIDGSFAPPEPAVALTFDVGISHFDDYSEVVIPSLRRFGFKGIFFIQTEGVLEVCDGKLTCWDSLAAWLAEGVISIGSHTVYHRDFTTLSPAQILLELQRSKQVLEQKLGVSVIGATYPFDAASRDAYPILESLGYRFAVGGWTRSERSARLADTEPYNLPRYYPYSNDSLYPALSGSGGLPFSELIAAAAAPAE